MGEGKIVARTYPAGTPTWTRDATANDSDKSFVVPANKRWVMKGIYYILTCTATAGNRVPKILFAPDGVNYYSWYQAPAVVPSGTGTGMITFEGITDDWVNVFTYSHGIMPMTLPAGAIIRIYDASAVDAAADDMTVILHYEELDV